MKKLFLLLGLMLATGCTHDLTLTDPGDTGSDTATDSDSGTDSAAALECRHISCVIPPMNECTPDGKLRLYTINGYCEEGICGHSYTDEDCDTGVCENGICKDTPCQGVSCNAPPASSCNGNELTSFKPQGVCEVKNSAPVCVYEEDVNTCAIACASGACVDEPCIGMYCNTPPARYCDGDTLRVWNTIGHCTVGVCEYAEQSVACAGGCEGGKCVGTPCEGIVCDTPPANYCDGNTLVEYGAQGTCGDGDCYYTSVETACVNGCEQAACVDETDTDTETETDTDTDTVDTDTDDCVGDPCDHGTCVDGVGSFICVCDPGYGGALCDNDIDDCSPDPCVNGTCTDGVDSYSCTCDEGWEGTLCDTGAATGTVWVSIPGGTFDMGSTTSSDEQPIHGVTVPSFEMLQTEVTAAQYEECVTAGSCTVPGTGSYATYGVAGKENNPVNYVNWQQAVDFCTWIGGRLPSEAEWEYAARSGGRDITYPWGDETATCSYAVMDDDTHTDGCDMVSTWAVCSKTAGNTDQGLCDMAGNVWEWVQDWYHSSYTGAPTDGSAWDDSGSGRVNRGGSFSITAYYLRAANRSSSAPTGRSTAVGFRCAR